jgi:hypothetical protein
MQFCVDQYFCKEEVNYLDYAISAKGVSTDKGKIEVVEKWPQPQTVKDLRSFLGFSSYYRRFVPKFTHMLLLFSFHPVPA